MTAKRAMQQIKPYPLGACEQQDGVRFSFVSEKTDCGVLLYDRASGAFREKVPFSACDRIGNVYCKLLEGVTAEELSYQFYEEGKILADPYARAFEGKGIYGQQRQEEECRAVLPREEFPWEGDERPRIPYEKCIGYCLHVRGFTAHASSGAAHPGTFLGLTEKLPYLRETGITTLELQPAYEFFELPTDRELEKEHGGACRLPGEGRVLNYWGYKKGFYYAPKGAYAAGEDSVCEFKTMVRTFHQNGMEVVMQFYFPRQVSRGQIPEILRFWVLEYHVDGFHLMGEELPVELIAQDPLLADSKIWYSHFDGDRIYGREEMPRPVNLAEYRDDYRCIMRKFLKGDEGMLEAVSCQMRHIPGRIGRVHYLSNYDGMTLADMVSYDYKHNEENGEENRDGTSDNYSWNCGEEGPTRKKKIAKLRLRQQKNALCLLFFSQSMPLIFMGDEFGNSQRGNNNPYCQDNEISWLNWKDLEKHQELYTFWKTLAALRREHPVLRSASEVRPADCRACGYPDFSCHGQNAWQPQMERPFRHMGMMYWGKYDFFYVAVNMHWEVHDLALPRLPKGLVWKSCIATCDAEEWELEELSIRNIPARSIVILKSEASG